MGTLADKLNYLIETKNAIKQAIIEKGQAILDGDTFRSYAEKIKAIQSGGEDTITESVQSSVDMPYEVIQEPAESIGAIQVGHSYTAVNMTIPENAIMSDFYTPSGYLKGVYGSSLENCIYYCKFKMDNNALSNSGAIYHVENVLNIEYNGTYFNAYSWWQGSNRIDIGDATADDWLYMAVKIEDSDSGTNYCTKKYYYSINEGFKLDDDHLKLTVADYRKSNSSQAAIGCSLYGNNPNTFFRGTVDLNETYVTNLDGTEYYMQKYAPNITIL